MDWEDDDDLDEEEYEEYMDVAREAQGYYDRHAAYDGGDGTLARVLRGVPLGPDLPTNALIESTLRDRLRSIPLEVRRQAASNPALVLRHLMPPDVEAAAASTRGNSQDVEMQDAALDAAQADEGARRLPRLVDEDDEDQGDQAEAEDEAQAKQGSASPPRASLLSGRWLIGTFWWLFLTTPDDPHAGLAWLPEAPSQGVDEPSDDGKASADGDEGKGKEKDEVVAGEAAAAADEREEVWNVASQAMLESIMAVQQPTLLRSYIINRLNATRDTTQLAVWLERACQAQREDVVVRLLRAVTALCMLTTVSGFMSDHLLECIIATLQAKNTPGIIKAGLEFLHTTPDDAVHELLEEPPAALEECVMALIDHPDVQVRLALLPVLSRSRSDFPIDVLMKRLEALKDETEPLIMADTMSALATTLSEEEILDQPRTVIETAMRGVLHEDRRVVVSAGELLEVVLDLYEVDADKEAADAMLWLVRELVEVIWKPRSFKSLLSLGVKCVRANLDKLHPLVSTLPEELRKRINPLEEKPSLHTWQEHTLWRKMPYAAALHSLNILISAYPICFLELSRIVDEYLEPEQSWRKREVGIFLLQCVRNDEEYSDVESEEAEEWARSYMPLVLSSLNHPHPQVRKVSCSTIGRMNMSDIVFAADDILKALWHVIANDSLEVAGQAISAMTSLACNSGLFSSQQDHADAFIHLVDICRQRPLLAEKIMRTVIMLIPLALAPCIVVQWTPSVIKYCLEVIQVNSVDAATLRTAVECLAEVVYYKPSAIDAHKEEVTQLLEQLFVHQQDHTRGASLMDALIRSRVDVSQFASPDTIVAFVVSVLQSSRPSVHKMSHVLDQVTTNHPQAVQRALHVLVPAIVSAIEAVYYDSITWTYLLKSINHWTSTFPAEVMAPYIEPLSACLARVSPAISEERAMVINTVGMMGFRHAHLVSPTVLRVFSGDWLRSARIVPLSGYDKPSLRLDLDDDEASSSPSTSLKLGISSSSSSSSSTSSALSSSSLSSSLPPPPMQRWEEAAEGLANVLEDLCGARRSDDSRYVAPVALATVVRAVLDTVRHRASSSSSSSLSADLDYIVHGGHAHRRNRNRTSRGRADVSSSILSARLKARLAAAVAAATSGWSSKQLREFVQRYWRGDDGDYYEALLRQFLSDIHPLVVLLGPRHRS